MNTLSRIRRFGGYAKSQDTLAFMFLVILLVWFLPGCSYRPPPDKDPTSGIEVIPEDLDQKLGDYMAYTIVSQYSILDDKKVYEQIKSIGQNLVEVSDCLDTKVTFVILNEPLLLSPFATLGGYIYVPTGFLDFLVNKDELAFILGHELAHVCARHPARLLKMNMDRGKVIQVLAEVASTAGSVGAGFLPFPAIDSRINPDLPRLASELGGTLATTMMVFTSSFISEVIVRGYGRKYEEQADKLGFQYGTKAGYDPRAIVSFWERYEDIKKEAESRYGMGFASNLSIPATERAMMFREWTEGAHSEPKAQRTREIDQE